VEPLRVYTLQSLVGYIARNVDDLPLEEMLVHVGPTRVYLLSAAYEGPSSFQRECWMIASALGPSEPTSPPDPFSAGYYYPAEEFIVKLQTAFVQDEGHVNELLELVSNIRESTVRDTTDDGVAQTVTLRDGVALAKEAKVPNPVSLCPWRTFREVEQPASAYLLRLKDGKEGGKPRCALFQADGNAWELEAAENVGRWLQQRMKEEGSDDCPPVIW
jgi:hypothetical protein